MVLHTINLLLLSLIDTIVIIVVQLILMLLLKCHHLRVVLKNALLQILEVRDGVYVAEIVQAKHIKVIA